MAFSPIENKYLSALAAVQFPTEPIEVNPNTQPGDVLLAAGPSNVMSDASGAAFGIFPGMGKRSQKSDIGEKMITGAPDFAAGAARGAATSALGFGGDIQKIGRFINALATDNQGGGIMDRLGRAAQTMEDPTFLPSSTNVSEGGYTIPGTSITLPGLPAAVPAGTSAFGMTPEERQKAAELGQNVGELVGDPLMLTKGGQMAVKGVVGAGKALAPKAAEMTIEMLEKTGMPARGLGIVESGPGGMQTPVLNRQEKAVISAGAGRKQGVKQEATDAAINLKSNYSEADGWAPIEINKVQPKFDKAGKYIKVEVEPKAIPYDFHTPPADVPVEAWQATMSSRVLDEVQTVVDRAAGGDKAALDILAEASWYRTMRDRLRTEFGGLGDVFADVLGTTSAQTDVRQNFKNAITVLTKFSRGDYDQTLAAYESRVAKGQPVDPETLIALDKAGDFDLIKSDAGKLFNTNSPATMGALMDMFRSIKAGDSPKTPNFTGNLIGLTNEATIDVWAARMLRRLADLPRIPPPAEKGVGGAHSKGSTLFDPKVSGEFGFGQDVFREAADEINKSGIIKSVAPEIGDLGPDDLQAVAWFIEKEKWTNNNWTTKAGEGGSLDYEMSLAGAADQSRVNELRKGINASFQPPARRKGETVMGEQAYEYRVNPAREQDLANKEEMRKELIASKADVGRYTLGISGERPGKPMSNYGQAELAAELDDVVRNDKSVVTYNLANTYGSFMGQTERALNAEFVAKQDFNPAPLERRMIEQGKAYDQDAVFISKVVKDGASENARPGVEIYFKQKISPDQMASVTAKLREYGVDGFTYVTDMRFNDRINVQARAGGAETAGLNGLRFQYIPEFDDAFSAANRASIMSEKQDLFRKVVRDIMKEGNVSDARLVHYDTKVYFRSDYDAYLARTAGDGNQAERGIGSSGSNATQSNTSGEVGQDFSRSVSDRLRKKAAGTKSPTVTGGRSAPQSGAN